MSGFAVSLSVLVLYVGLVGCASQPANEGPPPEGPIRINGLEGCDSPLGFIPEGQTAIGFLRPTENLTNCQQGTISCRDGVWSGPYIYPSCTRLSGD